MAQNTIKPGGAVLYLRDVKIAFYVVPKAACSSIKTMFGELYKESDEMWKKAVNRLRVIPDDVEEYYKIAICRNPWERAQSTYIEKLIESSRIKSRVAEHGFRLRMPFEEFIEVLCSIPDSEEMDKHIKSQYRTLLKDGNPDYLGRVETLDMDWKQIKRIFKERGKVLPELPRLNVTTASKPPWTTELFEKLRERYIIDVEQLGYSGVKYEQGNN